MRRASLFAGAGALAVAAIVPKIPPPVANLGAVESDYMTIQDAIVPRFPIDEIKISQIIILTKPEDREPGA